jgi:hypothetical protein
LEFGDAGLEKREEEVHAGDIEIREIGAVRFVQCVVDFRDTAAGSGDKVMEDLW